MHMEMWEIIWRIIRGHQQQQQQYSRQHMWSLPISSVHACIQTKGRSEAVERRMRMMAERESGESRLESSSMHADSVSVSPARDRESPSTNILVLLSACSNSTDSHFSLFLLSFSLISRVSRCLTCTRSLLSPRSFGCVFCPIPPFSLSPALPSTQQSSGPLLPSFTRSLLSSFAYSKINDHEIYFSSFSFPPHEKRAAMRNRYAYPTSVSVHQHVSVGEKEGK